MSGPTCPRCGAPDPAEAVELDRALYAAAYRAGWADAAGQGPAHPAVVESVARMFGAWQGVEAARVESVARFRRWHTEQREGGMHDRAA